MAGRITPALSTDIIISALAFLISVALSAYLFGAFLAPQPLTGALFDSRWYDQLGRALWSGDELPADHPPVPGYSYPFVATGLASVSPRLLILLQTGAISAGVFCLLRTERNLTGRILVAPLALLSVSLLLSPAFMMAEAFGFGLAAAALWAFTSANKAAWGVLLLIAASPDQTGIPARGIAVGGDGSQARPALVYGIDHRRRPDPAAANVVAGSDRAGAFYRGRAFKFQRRFYPAVVGRVEAGKFVSYKDDLALAALAKRPETADQIRYIRHHWKAAATTWASILWQHHLFAPSGFTNKDNTFAQVDARNGLKAISGVMSYVFAALLIPAVLGIAVLLRHWPFQVWPAAFAGLSIFAAAPLVYWQGDRIVFMLLPFASLGFRCLAGLGQSRLIRASGI